MTNTSKYFVQEFNRRLGQFTRNPAVRTPEAAMTLSLSARLLNEKQREKVAAELERQEYAEKLWEDKVSGKSSSVGGSSEPEYGNLSRDTAELLTDEGNSGFMSRIDLPEFIPGNEKISDFALDVGIRNPLKVGKFALDMLSRPSYAGFEATKEAIESAGEGQNPLESLDDIAKGFGSGLTGQEKTGFGDIIQEQVDVAAEPGGNPVGEFLTGGAFSAIGKQFGRYQDREGPGAEAQKWAQRIGGLGGEIFLDPMNLVGGKVLTTVGENLGKIDNVDDAYRALVGKTVDEAIDSRGLAKPFNKPRLYSAVYDPATGKKIFNKGPEGRTLLHQAAQRGIDNATIRIGGGSTKGRVIGPQVGAYTVANNVANEMRNFVLRNFDSFHTQFDDILSSSKTLTKAQIAVMRKDPIVAAYLDEFLALTKKANPASSLADVERILLKYQARNKDEILSISNRAAQAAKANLDDLIASTRKEIFEKLDNQVQNIPGVRLANKTIPLKRVGKAYHAGKARWGSPLEGVQYGEQFPSITPQIANAVKSTGQKAYEDFHADVQEIVKRLDLKKPERRVLNQAILDNVTLSDPRLQEAKEFIQRAYRQIWQDEVDAGIRSADDIMPYNYIYNYYKPRGLKGYMRNLDNYRRAVKLDVNKTKSLSPNHIRDAQARGLKVEQDAFRALLYRKLKSNRKLTQAWFKESLIDNFGIMSNRLSETLANRNKLTKVEATLTNRLKIQLGKGDHWYLPEDIYSVYDKYLKMTSGNATNEMSEFVHMIDTVTRWFKQAATIYYPGFHIRNSLGDMFMSFIDGVRASDYVDLKRIINKVRHNPGAEIDIAGTKFTWDQLKTIFDSNVSTGGFKRVDFDVPDVASKLNPNRASTGIRQASERREDFFRFTHFLHAFKEELPKALKKSNNPQTAIQTATRASSYRVNKYLFDYGATTLFEKKYLKRIFPFYTYTRKAMPALAEGMFLHPSQFAKTNRFFLDDDDGSYADMLTPEYQREIGYRQLSDGENPWLLGGQFLPTDVLSRNTNFADIPEFARNLMSQTNPLVKAGPELAAEQQFFNQRQIEDPASYFTDSFLPFVHPAEDLITGVKGAAGAEGGDKRKLLSGRFGLGLPISQVSNSQQTAALYGILDEYKAELGKLNPKLESKGYRIYVSPRKDGASFRIRNEETGDVIFDTTDLQEAIRRAKELSR